MCYGMEGFITYEEDPWWEEALTLLEREKKGGEIHVHVRVLFGGARRAWVRYGGTVGS